VNVLVTGGGGFLGRAVVGKLLARGYAVRSLGRSPQPALEAEGVTVYQGDLADYEQVAKAAEGCGAVFHVAARAGFWGDDAAYERVNVTGTQNVLHACVEQKVRWLIYTSTPSVVFSGEPFRGADERLPYGRNHLCAYSRTKAQAEQAVLAAHRPGELDAVALRPHLIWGEGDPHLLPRVIDRVKRGRLRIVGNGKNRVDITHVENAAAAHLNAFDALQGGQVATREGAQDGPRAGHAAFHALLRKTPGRRDDPRSRPGSGHVRRSLARHIVQIPAVGRG